MKVLVTGSGSGAGSWPVRGAQLGSAIGATVKAKAMSAEGFDLAVLVKRNLPGTVAAIKRAGIPLVYDIVDAWPQSEGNDWNREFCMAWLRAHLKTIQPDAIVAATQAMAIDCAEFGLPVLALRHHARPGQARNPIREHVRVVGYEGSTKHLGSWRQWLEKECSRRGLEFHVNPLRLADLDIVVALRERTGYAPVHWKSNVKLANAQASGTPIVCSREAGYSETSCGSEVWADTPKEVRAAFDELEPAHERRGRADALHAATPTLEAVAATYKEWLHTLPCLTARKS